MDDQDLPSAGEIGRTLTKIRENSGLKQKDLAAQTTISAAVLSRIENGDRAVDIEELSHILLSIGTDESKKLRDALNRKWKILRRPPLDHDDADLIWEAELILDRLALLRDDPETKSSFVARLNEYISEIKTTSELIINRDHQVAFIGSIGIGKSTAISKITRLEIKNGDDRWMPVLESGAGGITICEVHLKSGPGYGIVVEPRSDNEIRQLVGDFSEYTLKVTQKGPIEENNTESQIISKEYERAIRNMAGLQRRRSKDPSGNIVRYDEVKNLADDSGDARKLGVAILTRMNLHARDMRSVWYNPDSDGEPLAWLKNMFELINNGRHQGFTIPKRIEIYIPSDIIATSNYVKSVIDTKGIDQTPARDDLESLLNDSHTLVVLCSGFNNAPAAEIKLMLERARESNISDIELKTLILVLPRPDEAQAVKDETGILVDSIEEGYELKREQIEMALSGLGGNFNIEFFNSREEDGRKIANTIRESVLVLREEYKNKLSESIKNSKMVIENQEEEQEREVLRQVQRHLESWIKNHNTLPDKPPKIHDSLLGAIRSASASSIHASVRREGEWYNLNYSYHLGYGSRRLAVRLLSGYVKSFSEHCRTLSTNEEYDGARQFVAQAESILLLAYEDLLKKIQALGRNAFLPELKSHSELWHQSLELWGSGSGYRERIAVLNDEWFENKENSETAAALRISIEREWIKILERVESIFDSNT